MVLWLLAFFFAPGFWCFGNFHTDCTWSGVSLWCGHHIICFGKLPCAVLFAKMIIQRAVTTSTEVRIIAAYNLINADTGILGDVSDPYTTVRLESQSEKQRKRTHTINNDPWSCSAMLVRGLLVLAFSLRLL